MISNHLYRPRLSKDDILDDGVVVEFCCRCKSRVNRILLTLTDREALMVYEDSITVSIHSLPNVQEDTRDKQLATKELLL